MSDKRAALLPETQEAAAALHNGGNAFCAQTAGGLCGFGKAVFKGHGVGAAVTHLQLKAVFALLRRQADIGGIALLFAGLRRVFQQIGQQRAELGGVKGQSLGDVSLHLKANPRRPGAAVIEPQYGVGGYVLAVLSEGGVGKVLVALAEVFHGLRRVALTQIFQHNGVVVAQVVAALSGGGDGRVIGLDFRLQQSQPVLLLGKAAALHQTAVQPVHIEAEAQLNQRHRHNHQHLGVGRLHAEIDGHHHHGEDNQAGNGNQPQPAAADGVRHEAQRLGAIAQPKVQRHSAQHKAHQVGAQVGQVIAPPDGAHHGGNPEHGIGLSEVEKDGFEKAVRGDEEHRQIGKLHHKKGDVIVAVVAHQRDEHGGHKKGHRRIDRKPCDCVLFAFCPQTEDAKEHGEQAGDVEL